MKNVIETYWAIRKLLIGKLLLLDSNEKNKFYTPEDFFFGINYPDPTFLMTEDFRLIKCLIQLENDGWIRLKNIKIEPDYIDFYLSSETSDLKPELIRIAKKENYGLSKNVLNKVKQSKSITKEELISILQSKETKLINEYGDGLSVCIYRDYNLIFPFFIAHYLSFNITINTNKIENDITNYVNKFSNGLLEDNNQLYFGYSFQKELLLKTLLKVFEKQRKLPIVLKAGYWYLKEAPKEYEKKDELLSLFKREYPDFYTSWAMNKPIYDHQYNLRIYDTLLALEQERIIEIKNITHKVAVKTSPENGSYVLKDRSQVLTIIILNIKKLCLKNNKKIKTKNLLETTFEIQVRDRCIWVNNYLLSKPHAVGTNFAFFEYIRGQKNNADIKRDNLVEWLQKKTSDKRFIKILNELGFKGEIKKAFFSRVGKNILQYRGDKITKKDLEKSGINIKLFIKQLEVADLQHRQ